MYEYDVRAYCNKIDIFQIYIFIDFGYIVYLINYMNKILYLMLQLSRSNNITYNIVTIKLETNNKLSKLNV